jgi:hypothetical protein
VTLRLAALLALVPAAAAADPVRLPDDPVAALDRAVARWEASCRAPTADGACTRTRTVALKKDRCARETHAIDLVRSTKAARAARAALTVALTAVEQQPDAARPALAAVAARGRSALAEAAYEDFLRLRFPTGLDFSGARGARSQKRFAAFLDQATKALDAATEAYRRVSEHAGATHELRLRALARTGQLNADFAEMLLGSEIPRNVRTGELAADKIDAYCGAMAENVEPVEDRARALFEECSALAAGQPPWAAVCGAP